MAKDEGPKAGAIYWFCKGELRTLYAGVTDAQLDLLFARRRDRLFHRLIANIIHASTAIRRPACRRGEPKIFRRHRAAPTAGSTARWSMPTACCGTRAGAARASMPMSPDGKLHPLDRRAGKAILLPGLRRPERVADRRHLGLEGHGRRGARRRSRSRQDVPARHRGARPLRAARADLIGRDGGIAEPGELRPGLRAGSGLPRAARGRRVSARTRAGDHLLPRAVDRPRAGIRRDRRGMRQARPGLRAGRARRCGRSARRPRSQRARWCGR